MNVRAPLEHCTLFQHYPTITPAPHPSAQVLALVTSLHGLTHDAGPSLSEELKKAAEKVVAVCSEMLKGLPSADAAAVNKLVGGWLPARGPGWAGLGCSGCCHRRAVGQLSMS